MTSSPTEHRWVSRPLVALLLRTAILVVPLAAAVAAPVALSRLLPRPESTGREIAWWLLLVAVSTATLLAVDRAARRLLPLTALLRLGLIFPDRAPSRLRLALRSGSTRELRRRMADVQALHPEAEPSAAAARILGLAASIGAHDRFTRRHSERVRAFADLLALELGLFEGDRDRLRWAALLHDLGKLGVEPGILNKTGLLDEDEWRVIREHPATGGRLAAPLAPFLGRWYPAIGQHHERWNGSGYPHGLVGEQISYGARIVAVADAFEVMTSSRSYRRPMSAEAARTELVRCGGSDFDPDVVRALLSMSLGRIRLALGPLAWVAQAPLAAGGGSADVSLDVTPALPDGASLHAASVPHPALGPHPAWDSSDQAGAEAMALPPEDQR